MIQANDLVFIRDEYTHNKQEVSELFRVEWIDESTDDPSVWFVAEKEYQMHTAIKSLFKTPASHLIKATDQIKLEE